MTPEGGNFRLIYAGFDCGDEKDVIRWELADDGLHLFLISSNAPVEANKAYLETKPWQPVEPVVSTASRLTAHAAGEQGAPLGYYEYLPPGYGDDAPRPLLVVLHGYGESGDGSQAELDKLLETGIPNLIRRNAWPEDRPFVVLAPQRDVPRDEQPYERCEGVEFGASCWMEVQHQLAHPVDGSECMTPAEVNAFLSYAIASYDVDARRVYLTGLSCGAYAAYEYAAEYGATQIAAMVPVAGDARPALATAACELGAVAIWAFHGDADDLVDPDGSIQPMTSLRDCPQPPRQEIELTVYPGVDHDSWTRTYDGSAGNDIYEWFLKFSLP